MRGRIILYVLVAAFLSGCAARPVSLESRDRSGVYDGSWVASVGAPKVGRVQLGGNRTFICSWKPFEVVFTVEDGIVILGSREERTGISAEGEFVYRFIQGGLRSRRGTTSGNQGVEHFVFANLSNENQSGEYRRTIQNLGGGCPADIAFEKT